MPRQKKDSLKLIKELTLKLLNLLGVEKAKVKLEKQEEGIRVQVDCSQPEFLIGGRGEVISSLQLILSLMVYKKTGQWQKMVVNVADYLEQKEERLKKMALNAAQKVKFSGKEKALAFLSPADRRIIHLSLVDHPDVITESVGEGRERRLVVKPKK